MQRQTEKAMSTEQTPTPETDEPVSLREAADRPKGSISRIHQYDADACCRRFDELERQLAEARSAYEEETKSTMDMAGKIASLEKQLADIRKDRDHWRKMADDTHTIAQRDQASEAADKLASAILGEDIDWSDHSAKWEEALERLLDITSERDQLAACLSHLKDKDWFQDGTAGPVTCTLDAGKVRDALAAVEGGGK